MKSIKTALLVLVALGVATPGPCAASAIVASPAAGRLNAGPADHRARSLEPGTAGAALGAPVRAARTASSAADAEGDARCAAEPARRQLTG